MMYGHNHFSCLVSSCTDFFSFQFQCMINISYTSYAQEKRGLHIEHAACVNLLRQDPLLTPPHQSLLCSIKAQKHGRNTKTMILVKSVVLLVLHHTRKPNFKATLDACARCGNYIYCVNDAPSHYTLAMLSTSV